MATEILDSDETRPIKNLSQRGVLIASDGTVHVFYTHEGDLYHTYTQDNGASFASGTKIIDTINTAYGYDAVITSEDVIIAVAQVGSATIKCNIYASGSWGSAANADDGELTSPRLVIRDDDTIVLGCLGYSDGYPYYLISSDSGSTWSSPATIVGNAGTFCLATDGSRVYAVVSIPFIAQTSIYSYEGSWSLDDTPVSAATTNHSMIAQAGGPCYISFTQSGALKVYLYDPTRKEATSLHSGTGDDLGTLVRKQDSERVYLLYKNGSGNLAYRYLTDPATFSSETDTGTAINDVRTISCSDCIDIPILYDSGTVVYYDSISTLQDEPADIIESLITDNYRYYRIPRSTKASAGVTAQEPTIVKSNVDDHYALAQNKDYISIENTMETYTAEGLRSDLYISDATVTVTLGTDGGLGADVDAKRDHRKRMSAEIERIIKKYGVDPYQDQYTLRILEKEVVDADYENYFGCRYLVELQSQSNRADYDKEAYN